jgi:23S rRNA A2030 N6-methylase RlmJ
MQRIKIITIDVGYETDEEFLHILQGIMEALPKTSSITIEQWFDSDRFSQMED